jgi:ATP-dependent Clp protease adapter protein ClpS
LHVVADGAWTAAHDRSHQCIAAEHLFFALLHDDDVNAVLERAGADVHALFDEVTLLVDTVPTTSVPADDVLLRAMWARVTSGGDDVRPVDVLVALLAHDELRALVPLRTRNITRLSVLLALVPRPPRVVPTTAQAALVLHNDDHTSAEFVASVLHDVVKLDPAVALVRMREVHEAGQAVVATLATAQALEVAARVEKSARARGYPLAVSLQPA